jgi:hypothetical protein
LQGTQNDGVHAPSGEDFHGYIHSGSGVGEGADGDEIDSCLGDCGDGGEIHSAACFELHASGRHLHRCPQGIQGHVVEQDDVDMRQGQEQFNLLKGICLEFNLEVRVIGFEVEKSLAEELDVCGSDVVILHHDHIVEAESVIGPASCEDRLFFEETESGSGLSSVEDARFCVGDRFHVLVGEGGDTGQALEKVEGGAFSGQERVCGRGYCEDGIIWLRVGSIGRGNGDRRIVADAPKNLCGGHCSCDDHRLFCEQAGSGRERIGKVAGCQVTLTDVLVEGVSDRVVRVKSAWVHGG